MRIPASQSRLSSKSLDQHVMVPQGLVERQRVRCGPSGAAACSTTGTGAGAAEARRRTEDFIVGVGAGTADVALVSVWVLVAICDYS